MVLAAIAVSAAAQTPSSPGKPTLGSFGVDLAGRDSSVKPGDDFYRYVNGTWLFTTVIPSGGAEVGAYASLGATPRARVDDLLANEAKRPSSKIGAFSASFTDVARIQALGAKPFTPTLERIARAADRNALSRVMADLQREGVTGLFAPLVFADAHDPTSYVVYFEQDGLGLPGRHFYIDEDRSRAKAGMRISTTSISCWRWPGRFAGSRRCRVLGEVLVSAPGASRPC